MMGRLRDAARAHAAVTAAGALLVLVGGGVATAVTLTPTADSQVYEQPAQTSSDTSAPTPTPTPTTMPPEPAAADTAAPTVADVTSSPAPAPVEQPADLPVAVPEIPEGHQLPDLAPGQDPEGVGSIGPDGRYTPAPPRQNPGEPAPGPDWGPSPVEPDVEPDDIG